LAPAKFAQHCEARDFRDGAARQPCRIDDRSVEAGSAEFLERQGCGRIGEFRPHEPGTTDRQAFARFAKEQVDRVVVVVVTLLGVGSDRLETKLLAVHAVANPIDLLDQRVGYRRNYFKTRAETLPQAEPLRIWHRIPPLLQPSHGSGLRAPDALPQSPSHRGLRPEATAGR